MTPGAPAHYTPDRVDYYVRNVEHLWAWAQTPTSARQLLDPHRPGPTPTNPRSARQRGHHSDPNRGSDIVADLDRAYHDLPEGLGRTILYWRLWGYRPSAIYEALKAKGKGVRKQEFYHVNRAAVERMAEFLGWEPPPEEEISWAGAEPPSPDPSPADATSE